MSEQCQETAGKVEIITDASILEENSSPLAKAEDSGIVPSCISNRENSEALNVSSSNEDNFKEPGCSDKPGESSNMSEDTTKPTIVGTDETENTEPQPTDNSTERSEFTAEESPLLAEVCEPVSDEVKDQSDDLVECSQPIKNSCDEPVSDLDISPINNCVEKPENVNVDNGEEMPVNSNNDELAEDECNSDALNTDFQGSLVVVPNLTAETTSAPENREEVAEDFTNDEVSELPDDEVNKEEAAAEDVDNCENAEQDAGDIEHPDDIETEETDTKPVADINKGPNDEVDASDTAKEISQFDVSKDETETKVLLDDAENTKVSLNVNSTEAEQEDSKEVTRSDALKDDSELIVKDPTDISEENEEQDNNKETFPDEEPMQVDEHGVESNPTNEESTSILEGSVQPEDSMPVDDASSIAVGLVDYPSDSEDLPEKRTEGTLEEPKTQTLVHTPCFEEDAQSSWSVDATKSGAIKIKDITSTVDEDSRASSFSQKSASKRPYSDEEVLPAFTAEQLFEYRWPVDGGEFFLIQEHISEYLVVKSFKRKYPDLVRRPVEVGEKRFLRDKGVVSETQCDLGLTAIRSDDVLELMSKDYPDKYQEYIQVLQERERQKINSKHKEYTTPSIDKTKMNDFVMKAIKATAEFNMHLNQERREERKTSFDMQTFTIHVPANKVMKLSKEETKVGKYPVALLPGQFQDYYRPYSSKELKYFPINTVLYGPLKELPTVYTQHSSDGSQSDSEDSCASDGSSCSSSQGSHDSGDSSSGSESVPRFKTEPNPDVQAPTMRIKDRLNATCKVCHGSHERNKEGYPEDLIHCSECGTSGHPSCLDVTPEMVEAIKSYSWQCIDCKTCMLCMDPYDEDKMMFCDKCDRGYHTFCVGLKNLPNGRWICQLCGQCSSCGSRTPGPEGSKAQWQQDSTKNNADKKPHLLCLNCAKPSKR